MDMAERLEKVIGLLAMYAPTFYFFFSFPYIPIGQYSMPFKALFDMLVKTYICWAASPGPWLVGSNVARYLNQRRGWLGPG